MSQGPPNQQQLPAKVQDANSQDKTSLQDTNGLNEGYRILSEFLAGLLLFGGLGWLGDHFLHTVFLTPIGIIVGMGLAVYLVYLRHTKGERAMFREKTGTPDSAKKGETR